MPELPEVETVVNDLLAANVVGCRIVGVRLSWARTLAEPSLCEFTDRTTGVQIVGVSRRAKYIVISLSTGEWLLIHLRMTGRLQLSPHGQAHASHERAALILDEGRDLCFIDTRKFGRWRLVDDLDSALGHLGPEPLDVSFKSRDLATIMHSHHRMLKPLLLDQHCLAGLGNIYVDEALWDAQLHPCQLSHSLSQPEILRLYRAIRKVLRRGIRSMGTSLGTGKGNFYSVAGRRGRNQDGLRVFRRDGQPCPRCDAILERLIVGQRSTHICPTCQLHIA
jgi:formamidopyrimidine-DNA glycosylase